MGKSTISMTIFNRYVSYQRDQKIGIQKYLGWSHEKRSKKLMTLGSIFWINKIWLFQQNSGCELIISFGIQLYHPAIHFFNGILMGHEKNFHPWDIPQQKTQAPQAPPPCFAARGASARGSAAASHGPWWGRGARKWDPGRGWGAFISGIWHIYIYIDLYDGYMMVIIWL